MLVIQRGLPCADSKGTVPPPPHLTCGAQAQEHSHPERPEEEEASDRPQRLQQQERTAVDGLVGDPQELNGQFHSLSQDKNQHEQNGLVREGRWLHERT